MRKKQKWNRSQKLSLLALIVACVIFLLGPVRDDIYKCIKQRSYLILKDKYNNLLKAFSDRTSVLAIRPLYLLPYTPEHPQSESQFKGLIVAEIKIKNRRLANNIHIEFIVDFGRGQKHSSADWNATAKQKSLIFSMFHPDVRFVTWSPDIPQEIKEIAKNRENPCTLQLIVTWKDIDKKKHRLESYSELHYNKQLDVYYFDERENKLLS